ncbi:MAG: diguanylate cyclase, partial [bacterium]
MIAKLENFFKIISFFRKINVAIFILLIVNILIFVFTLYWLKINLENNLIRYMVDFYIAISQNISSRIKRYVEYEQLEALRIILQQEYYNQDLVYISVFDNRGLNLVYVSRYPKLMEHFSIEDPSFFKNKTISFKLEKKHIEIDKNISITKLLIIYLPLMKNIISDIQEEIKIGYVVIAFDLTKLDKQLNEISFYSWLVVFLLSLFSVLVSFFMISQFYSPIEYLKKLTMEISKRKFDLEKKSFWFNEFNYLVDSFLRMSQVLEQQLTMLEAIASIDSLTKLYNRGAFEKFYNAIFIENKMKAALGLTKTFAIVMMDIDNFKKINDTYGHSVGDKVLSLVAEVVKNRKRNTDIAARYGGEEFILVLNVPSKIDALKFCLNLKDIISTLEIKVDKNITLKVSASFGISF